MMTFRKCLKVYHTWLMSIIWSLIWNWLKLRYNVSPSASHMWTHGMSAASWPVTGVFYFMKRFVCRFIRYLQRWGSHATWVGSNWKIPLSFIASAPFRYTDFSTLADLRKPKNPFFSKSDFRSFVETGYMSQACWQFVIWITTTSTDLTELKITWLFCWCLE